MKEQTRKHQTAANRKSYWLVLRVRAFFFSLSQSIRVVLQRPQERVGSLAARTKENGQYTPKTEQRSKQFSEGELTN